MVNNSYMVNKEINRIYKLNDSYMVNKETNRIYYFLIEFKNFLIINNHFHFF